MLDEIADQIARKTGFVARIGNRHVKAGLGLDDVGQVGRVNLGECRRTLGECRLVAEATGEFGQ